MSVSQFIKASYLKQEQGIRRVGTNADFTPGGNFTLFQIANGPIKVTSFFAHVTTLCAGAALVPLITFTSEDAATVTNLCVVAIGAAHPIDEILTWDGGLQAAVGVLAPTATLGHSATGGGATEDWDGGHLILAPGIIGITNATADATATIDWIMTFIRYGTDVAVTVL